MTNIFKATTWLPLLCISLLACNRGDKAAGDKAATGGAPAQSTKTIGVTLLTREHVFYRELEEGLKTAADQNHYKLIVTSGDFDLAKQQSQIDNFIVQHVDAIIVAPVDSKGIGPAIVKAAASNIPVFTADIAAPGAPVVTHVASDNLAGGKLAGEYIAKAIGGKGDVGLIDQPEVQSGFDREQGFRDALKAYPDIHLVAALSGSGVRDRALKAADDMLQAHPTIKAIFAINDDSALGTLSAAESRHLGNLIIVGYDATPEAQKAILAGRALKADVAQQPRLIGSKTIEAIAAHFAGKPSESKLVIPVRIVDATTLRAESPAATTATPQ